MNITTIMVLWWAAIIITAYQNNSLSIMRKNNIPFVAKGYTVSTKSVKEAIKNHADNKILVKKLKRALFFTRLSTILMFGWIITILIFLYLGSE